MRLDLCEFINRHLKFHQTVDYGEDGKDLFELIELYKATLCHQDKDTALIDVPIPVKIVGDIHGQFFDLQRIFLSLDLPGKARYLFLGDYVDRGPNSVECIALLLALKLTTPNRIFLLRGNHEVQLINRIYGFWYELYKRFKLSVAMNLYREFNTIFSYMPLAALIRGRILCCHGGLSPKLHSLNDIRKIKLPITDLSQGSLAQDLLWADPARGISGFEFNELREVSVCFGEDVVKKTCAKNGLDFIVRAHQVMANGYGFFANRKLITVFSASKYQPDLNNRGAVMVIDKLAVISFVIFNPIDTVQDAGVENFRRTFSQSGLSSSMNISIHQ